MTSSHRAPRPKALLDAIEDETPRDLAGNVWRVVTDGMDPLRPARAGGRWDDGTFDALYTASERDGALAEAWFHLSRGLPVIPSKPKKRLHRIKVELERVLDLSTTGKLAALGLDMTKYGQLSYVQRIREYPAPQQIAEIAFFYEYQAIMVPNARWPSSNVVILTENVRPNQVEARDSEIVDLSIWASKHWKRGQSHAD